jgi:hypothetical protein
VFPHPRWLRGKGLKPLTNTLLITDSPRPTAPQWSILRDPAVSKGLATGGLATGDLATGDLATGQFRADSIKHHIGQAIDDLMGSLPDIESLSPVQQRGIIARYSAVLEGNFIYWMSGAYLAARSEEVRAILLDNLHEEIRDCHPGMLRRFAVAAKSVPDDIDAMAVDPKLSAVRLFIGRLSPEPILAMMAFFEGFIQRFMPYLAELARRQGSVEQEYTDVHGTCDVVHSQELFRALAAELALGNFRKRPHHLFEGISLLESLIEAVVFPVHAMPPAAGRGI